MRAQSRHWERRAQSTDEFFPMSDVDIDAYFERIGFSGSIAPTLETLQQLHALHPAAIPFENLDSLLGVPVRLEHKNLEQKLLFDRRGGYCLEHNLLFKALLQDLDFSVKALGATVLWGMPEGSDRPPTHMALAVEVSGSTYLCDVGFGRLTLTGPLRMRTELEQETPHDTFRLVSEPDQPDWRLEAKVGDEWRPLYKFTQEEKVYDDFQAMNDYLSNDPRFRENLAAARSERGRRYGLRNGRLTTYVTGEPGQERMLKSVGELRDVLTGTFGINLPSTDRLDPALEAVLAKEPA
jgi:N-hydroxyarylamine O-acetyltransferase